MRFLRRLISPAIFRFFPFIRPYMLPILGCTAVSLIASSGGALLPMTLKYVVDHLAADAGAIQPLPYLALLAVVVIGLEAFQFLIDYVFTRVNLGLEIDLRLRLLTSMLQKRVSFLTDRHSGQLISMMYNDLHLAKLVPDMLIRLFLEFPLRILFAFGTMCYLDPYLTLVVFAAGPPTYGVLRWLRRYRRRISSAKLSAMDWITRDFHEFISGAKLIKLWGMEDRCRSTLAEESHQYKVQSLREISFGYLVKGAMSIMAVFILGIVFYVVAMRLNAGAAIGDYAGFLLALWLFFQTLKRIAVGYGNFIDSGVAVDRLLEIIETSENDELDPGTGDGVDRIRSVAWEDAAFEREGQEIVASVTLSLTPGRLHIVVGPNGAGKSTLAESLMGFIQPSRGRLRINGAPMADLSLGALRQRISWVPQDMFLVHGSVRDNIWLNVSEADPAARTRYEDACRIAGVDAALDRRQRSDADSVAERGGNFSGGEKQRISLARAMVKPHDVLILDEANSHITHADFIQIIGQLRRMARDRIVVFITHNDRFIAAEDQVFEFKDKTVLARGGAAP